MRTWFVVGAPITVVYSLRVVMVIFLVGLIALHGLASRPWQSSKIVL
jgi:hypothetical protein